jgi:hypothetical protein
VQSAKPIPAATWFEPLLTGAARLARGPAAGDREHAGHDGDGDRYAMEGQVEWDGYSGVLHVLPDNTSVTLAPEPGAVAAELRHMTGRGRAVGQRACVSSTDAPVPAGCPLVAQMRAAGVETRCRAV